MNHLLEDVPYAPWNEKDETEYDEDYWRDFNNDLKQNHEKTI